MKVDLLGFAVSLDKGSVKVRRLLPRSTKIAANIRSLLKSLPVLAKCGVIAIMGAEISHKLKVPMADALNMATSNYLRVRCVTDEPHFTEVERTWI